MIKKSLFLLALTLSFALSACSDSQSSVNQAESTQATDSSSAPLSENQLKAILLKSLRSDCSDINKFVLTPENWQVVDSTESETQFLLEADGGYLLMSVIPDGAGGANVMIPETDDGTTNNALYLSGCKTLASAPAGSTSSNKKSQPKYPKCEKLANTKDSGLAVADDGGWHWGLISGKPGYCVLPNSSEVYYYSGE